MISWLVTDAHIEWPIVKELAMFARIIFRSTVALEISPIISKYAIATVLTRVLAI